MDVLYINTQIPFMIVNYISGFFSLTNQEHLTDRHGETALDYTFVDMKNQSSTLFQKQCLMENPDTDS